MFVSGFRSDVGNHHAVRVTDGEASRVFTVTVVDDALTRECLPVSLEPHRHRELVHLVVGKPRTEESNL